MHNHTPKPIVTNQFSDLAGMRQDAPRLVCNPPMDAEGLIQLSQVRQGPMRGDWMMVGSVGAPLALHFHADAIAGHRVVLACDVQGCGPWFEVARGECSLKESREWATSAYRSMCDSMCQPTRPPIAVARLSSARGGGRRRTRSAESDQDKIIAQIAKIQKQMDELRGML